MTELIAGGLFVASGLAAMGWGAANAQRRFQRLQRLAGKHQLLQADLPEGWGWWFVQGFSDMTIGWHSIQTLVLLLGWAMGGAILIGLGLQVMWW